MKLYSTYIFDCDGVLLNSNKAKTEAFYEVTEKFGKNSAQDLVNYHVLNGGISRYEKFSYFIEKILPKNLKKPKLDELLEDYAKIVWDKLISCEIAPNLDLIKKKTKGASWMVISGGKQDELIKLFKFKGIFDLFDGGIFGSPNSKIQIFKEQITTEKITGNSLFFGDSIYDWEVAVKYNIDFVFVSNWTEVVDFSSFCSRNKILSIKSLDKFNYPL
tara:strand:+ start:3071 stop:3721 length:651 start_codon:yes stop_codon:yes gene_type:complete